MKTSELGMGKSMENLSNDVIDDLNVVVSDTEALLRETANQGGEKLDELRAKAEQSLGVVKARMAEAQAALLVKTKEAAKVTDAYVHENPWQAAGVAAGVGLLVGLLIGRR